MLFPVNDFQKCISNVFYDKTVSVKEVTITTSTDGQRIKTIGSVLSTFMGNVQFGNRKIVAEQYGLKYDFDLTITTNQSVDLNTIICYDSVDYVVTDVLKFDSHNLVIAKKYE